VTVASTGTPPQPGSGMGDPLDAFLGIGSDRVRTAVARSGGRFIAMPHGWALVSGSLWAAHFGLWGLFWLGAFVDVGAVTLLVRDWAGAGDTAIAALFLFVAGRLVFAMLAIPALWHAYLAWRRGHHDPARPSVRKLAAGALTVVTLAAVAILRFGTPLSPEALVTFPTDKAVPRAVSGIIDNAVDWMVVNLEGFFRAVTISVRELLDLLELAFIGMPWPIVFSLTVVLAWRVAGWKVAVFASLSLLYLGLFGFWEKSMSTMSLVMASALFCISVGVPIGVLCAKRPRLYGAVRPVLDFMQVMPTFVYLIPAVAFFSIGKPPGVLATVIFALPPMIRLTALGIEQVPVAVREAGLAFGAGPWQLLAKVELPIAVPSIMTGINQTIMMCLSMVIISSMIGAGGLGYDVLVSLRLLKTGEGFLAGTAIVVCAMVLDRIIQGQRAEPR